MDTESDRKKIGRRWREATVLEGRKEAKGRVKEKENDWENSGERKRGSEEGGRKRMI